MLFFDVYRFTGFCSNFTTLHSALQYDLNLSVLGHNFQIADLEKANVALGRSALGVDLFIETITCSTAIA